MSKMQCLKGKSRLLRSLHDMILFLHLYKKKTDIYTKMLIIVIFYF